MQPIIMHNSKQKRDAKLRLNYSLGVNFKLVTPNYFMTIF